MTVFARELSDERNIHISVPKTVMGIIVHKIYLKDNNTNSSSGTNGVSNKCAECTFIKDFGQKSYYHSLFSLSCVLSYITRSQSNIVVTKL